jgi:hypothetical protein
MEESTAGSALPADGTVVEGNEAGSVTAADETGAGGNESDPASATVDRMGQEGNRSDPAPVAAQEMEIDVGGENADPAPTVAANGSHSELAWFGQPMAGPQIKEQMGWQNQGGTAGFMAILYNTNPAAERGTQQLPITPGPAIPGNGWYRNGSPAFAPAPQQPLPSTFGPTTPANRRQNMVSAVDPRVQQQPPSMSQPTTPWADEWPQSMDPATPRVTQQQLPSSFGPAPTRSRHQNTDLPIARNFQQPVAPTSASLAAADRS